MTIAIFNLSKSDVSANFTTSAYYAEDVGLEPIFTIFNSGKFFPVKLITDRIL